MGLYPVVAIDGPAGSGKSTIAALVADALGYLHVDTGAMYRAAAWLVLEKRIDPRDREKVGDLVESVDLAIRRENGLLRVYIDGRDVADLIRSEKISEIVPLVAGIPRVRKRMVAFQREKASAGPVVMEGRDIGSVVFPDARVKVFLSASPEERARRRCSQLTDSGERVDQDSVLREVLRRDELDSTREDSPLTIARDAFKLDTTALTIDDVVERIVALVRVKLTDTRIGSTEDGRGSSS